MKVTIDNFDKKVIERKKPYLARGQLSKLLYLVGEDYQLLLEDCPTDITAYKGKLYKTSTPDSCMMPTTEKVTLQNEKE